MNTSVIATDRVRPVAAAAGSWALIRCLMATVRLLSAGRVRLPTRNVGRTICFADGTTGRVFRETELDVDAVTDPATLIVMFRLRWIGSHAVAHRLFRIESLCNTLLFVGFPGFVSKLWIAADEAGRYRGVYEWDSAELATSYVRALWWPLALVSERSSICFHVVPNTHRDDAPTTVVPAPEDALWWRMVLRSGTVSEKTQRPSE